MDVQNRLYKRQYRCDFTTAIPTNISGKHIISIAIILHSIVDGVLLYIIHNVLASSVHARW